MNKQAEFKFFKAKGMSYLNAINNNRVNNI